MKLLVMYSSPLPCYLIPLGPKYPPKHLILENLQPKFLSQCEPQISCVILFFHSVLQALQSATNQDGAMLTL